MELRILTVVDLVASEGRNTGSSTSVTNTATLTVLSDGTGTRARGRGAGGSGGSGRVGGGASAGGRAAKSGTDGTELDVGVGDLGVRGVGLNVRGSTGGGRAVATSDTGRGRVRSGRVVGVEPEHVRLVVVPDGHDEDHTRVERLAHGRETAELLKRVGVAERGLLRGAEVGGDRVECVDAGDVGLRVGDHLAILDVETADLAELAGRGVVRREELRDDGDLGRGVDGLAGAVELLVAHAERVEVTAVLVAERVVAVVAAVSAVVASAGGLLGHGADVRGVGFTL